MVIKILCQKFTIDINTVIYYQCEFNKNVYELIATESRDNTNQ